MMISRKLLKDFQAHFGLHQDDPLDLDLPAAAALRSLCKRAQVLLRAGPVPHLSAEERIVLGPAHPYSMDDILIRCIEGLANHPEISRDTGVTPQTIEFVRGQRRQAGALATGASEVLRRSSDASLWARTEAARLAGGVLDQVGRRRDPDCALQALFSPALQRRQDERDSAAQARKSPPADEQQEAGGEEAGGEGDGDDMVQRLRQATDDARMLLAQRRQRSPQR